MAKGKNNNGKNQGARANDPQRDALLRARNIISGKESNLEGLDDVIAILEQMGKHDLVATLKKHVERLGNQTAGEIVVNEEKAGSTQEALTINEGPDLEEREHPSDFKENDWFKAYSNEIRTLLTNDANEDEKQIAQNIYNSLEANNLALFYSLLEKHTSLDAEDVNNIIENFSSKNSLLSNFINNKSTEKKNKQNKVESASSEDRVVKKNEGSSFDIKI